MFLLNDLFAASPPSYSSGVEAVEPLGRLIPELASVERVAGAAPPRHAELAALDEGMGRELLQHFVLDRCAATRNALAAHYSVCALRAARGVYRGMHRDAKRLIELSDVEQSAAQLVHGLIERYDVTRGIPLSAYLMGRLPHALMDEFRAMGICQRKDRMTDARPRQVSLDSTRGGGEARPRQVADAAPGPVRCLELREFRRGVMRAVPRELRLVVALRCFRGMQLWQAARRMHVTCAEASAMFERAIPYLTRALGCPTASPRAVVMPKAEPTPAKAPREPARAPLASRRATHAVGRSDKGAARAEPSRSSRTAALRRATPKRPAAAPGEVRRSCGVEDLIPRHLRREKAFRRWFVLNVPWAYRRFVAYHHLRGLDVSRVADKLGVTPEKVRDLDRTSQGIVKRAVATWRGE